MFDISMRCRRRRITTSTVTKTAKPHGAACDLSALGQTPKLMSTCPGGRRKLPIPLSLRRFGNTIDVTSCFSLELNFWLRQ